MTVKPNIVRLNVLIINNYWVYRCWFVDSLFHKMFKCLKKGFLSLFERNVTQCGSLIKFSFIMSGTCSNSRHNYAACAIAQIGQQDHVLGGKFCYSVWKPEFHYHTTYNKTTSFIRCRNISFLWRCGPTRAMASTFTRFLDHTQRRIIVGRIPLDKWSVRRRHLYVTTHNPHNIQTSMPPVGFEPTISVGERPQTYALDRSATGTGAVIFT